MNAKKIIAYSLSMLMLGAMASSILMSKTGSGLVTFAENENEQTIALSSESLSLMECESADLFATVSSTENTKVIWKSSDQTIASVTERLTNDGTFKATVTALEGGYGNATITATTEDGEQIASCTVSVYAQQSHILWEKQSLDGSEDQGIDTGMKLFSSECPNWTIFSYAFDSKNPCVDKNATLYQCVTDIGPWDGLRVDADNGVIPITSTTRNAPLRPRLVMGTDTYYNTQSKQPVTGSVHETPEDNKHPFYMSRSGNQFFYSFDGITWTEQQTKDVVYHMGRVSEAALTIGFDYKRLNGAYTSDKYRLLKTDKPVCVAVSTESKYKFSRLFKDYDYERKVEYAELTKLSKEEDSTLVHVYDYSAANLRSLRVYDLNLADGYTLNNFEDFLTKYYGAEAETFAKEGLDRTWASGSNSDYFINAGGDDVERNFVFPWWVTSFKYQAVNDSVMLPDEGVTPSYHGSDLIRIEDGIANIQHSEASTQQNLFDAIAIRKVGINSSTLERVNNIHINNELSVIFDTYPNGAESPEAPQTVNGYNFEGWYLDESLTIPFTKQVYETHTTIYAKLVPTFNDDFYLVGSVRGWDDPTTAEIFTKVNDNQYVLENVTFANGEEWGVQLGQNSLIEMSLFTSESVFGDYMSKGTNLTVSELGSNYAYNIYITLSNGDVTEVEIEFVNNVEVFANEIISRTKLLCALTNETQRVNGLAVVWKELYKLYVDYPQCEKDKFVEVVANSSGNIKEQAAARYDLICRKYGTRLVVSGGTYTYNFAERADAVYETGDAMGLVLNTNKAGQTAFPTIVIFAVVIVAPLAFISIRKRHH